MPKGRILVVDDQAEVRSVLRLGLESDGWQVVEAATREQLFAALERESFDLVTLDLVLGEVDGLDLARSLRAGHNIPVLMITAKSQPIDRVTGLDHGADDYIVKPFHIREVLMRIERVLERYQNKVNVIAKDEIVFDHATFDGRSGRISHADGTSVDLTGTEQQILELFTRNPGRILSRDDISQALHGRDWSPYDRTIDGHVARLRRKLEPQGNDVGLIRSVRGVGYVFTGEVKPKEAMP